MRNVAGTTASDHILERAPAALRAVALSSPPSSSAITFVVRVVSAAGTKKQKRNREARKAVARAIGAGDSSLSVSAGAYRWRHQVEPVI